MQPCISAIGIANPDHKIKKEDIVSFMTLAHELTPAEKHKLKVLYRATGIMHRYSVLSDYGNAMGDFDFYPNNKQLEPFPGTLSRMRIYKEEAPKLSIKAIEDCISQIVNFQKEKISHLITVSCTGMYAPGLDIDIINQLDLSPNIHRVNINFMGCYAAFNALKTAQAICNTDEKAKVLIVCVELCTLHFQKIKNEDNIFANALFSDGAAAALVEKIPSTSVNLSLESFYCDLANEGSDDMAWNIGEMGFEMKLSYKVPDIIKNSITQLVAKLSKTLKKENTYFKKYAIHPGGRKILEVIEKEIGFSRESNKYAHQVLKDYGNMSSASILFVLRKLMDDIVPADHKNKVLGAAFGPGLTLESMVLNMICR